MEAPKCSVCEKRHWGVCKMSEAKISNVNSTMRELMPSVSDISNNSLTGAGVPEFLSNGVSNKKSNKVSNGSLLESNKFDKRSYQREYMRARRKKGCK